MTGPEVIKLECTLKLILSTMIGCLWTHDFILGLRMNSRFITSGPGFLALRPKYCKSGNFRENFIFANSIKKQLATG